MPAGVGARLRLRRQVSAPTHEAVVGQGERLLKGEV
jgi:hypothetical protein